jgi:hypothetical protein
VRSLTKRKEISGRIVQDLLSQILVDIGALYKVSEAASHHVSPSRLAHTRQVALVDMLWSFAHASISEMLLFTCYSSLKLEAAVVRNYGLYPAVGISNILHYLAFSTSGVHWHVSDQVWPSSHPRRAAVCRNSSPE